MKLLVSNALRIPGRGTVLVTEVQDGDAPLLTAGQVLNVDNHHVLVRAVERHGSDHHHVGLVMADGIMPADLQLPTTATVRIELEE